MGFRSASRQKKLSLLFVIIVFPSLLKGEVRSPFSASIDISESERAKLRILALEPSTPTEKTGSFAIRPIRVSGFVPTLGRVRFSFTSKTLKTWTSLVDGELDNSSVVLLQGKAHLVNRFRLGEEDKRLGVYPASGALINQKTFVISFARKARVARFYRLRFNIDEAYELARVQQAPTYALASRVCGALEINNLGVSDSATVQALTAAATVKTIDFGTACDPECISLLGGSGSSANAQIAAFTNEINTIYLRDLSLDINLVRQVAYTSAVFNSDNAVTLLEDFEARPSSELGSTLDIKHLITGRDLFAVDGGTIIEEVVGIANFGKTCRTPAQSVSLTQHYNSLFTPIIMAHELGHNLGANHTASGIMIDTLGGTPPSEFSSFSKTEIGAFVEEHGICLAESSSSSSSSSSSHSSVSSGSSSSSSGGSGRSGGSAGGELPAEDEMVPGAISLTYSGTILTINVATPAGYSGCTMALKGAFKRLQLESEAGAFINEVVTDGTTAYSTTVERVKRRPGQRGKKAFFRAIFSCTTGGESRTPIRGVIINSKQGTLRTPSAWLSAVSTSLTQ